MKTIIKKSIKDGAVAGVILAFFELINFTTTLSIILQKLFGDKLITSADPVFMHIVIGLIVLLTAVAWVRRIMLNKNCSIFEAGLGGIVIGTVAAIFVSILNIILGSFLNKGIDVRTYLDAMGPDVIKAFLFESTIGSAVADYFVTCILAALLGAVLTWISQKTGQPAGLFSKIKNWFEGLHIGRVIEQHTWIKVVLTVLCFAILFGIPLISSSYAISILGIVLIYVILGLGLNLIVGLSGQLVFGYVAFYALGAYTFGLLTAPKPFGIYANYWIAMIAAMIVAAFGGFLIGIPTMSLRGDYLAIVTLGFGEIVRILINSNILADYTGGPQGIKNIGQPVQPKFLASIFGKPLEDNVYYLYIILVMFLIVLFVCRSLQYSRLGRVWEAMRDDETVAQACGVTTSSYKLLVVVIGAAIAGIAGALYASRNTYTGPAEYAFMVSVNALSVVVIGGMGSIPGTFLGAFVIKGLPELLRDLENYRMLVFGALLIIMMVLRPEGLIPVKRHKLAVPAESMDVLKEEMKS